MWLNVAIVLKARKSIISYNYAFEKASITQNMLLSKRYLCLNNCHGNSDTEISPYSFCASGKIYLFIYRIYRFANAERSFQLSHLVACDGDDDEEALV